VEPQGEHNNLAANNQSMHPANQAKTGTKHYLVSVTSLDAKSNIVVSYYLPIQRRSQDTNIEGAKKKKSNRRARWMI
jgi:hypothetical protein